jgi:hypothetical protein
MKPSANSAHLHKTVSPPVQPPPEEPKWEAATPQTPPSASDLVAQKAADYAKTMQTGNSSVSAASGSTGEVNPSLLGDAPNRHNHKPQVAIDTPISTPEIPTGTVSHAPNSTLHTPAAPLPGDPQIVPESEDFQTVHANDNDPLGNRLRKRLAQNPRDIADQLDLQLFGMLNDDPVAELASVSAMPDDDRELVAALVDGLSNFRSTVRQDGNLLAAQKIKPLLEMADRLRSQADLSVPTVALCSRVEAYGKYTPISPARFPAGRDNPAIVYCEVENFLAKQNADKMWQTQLSEEVTLFTDQGMMVWSDPERQVTDQCRNRRHDFFAYNVIHLPANLTIGRYMLKVSITDKNANRVAEATVPLSIVAQ